MSDCLKIYKKTLVVGQITLKILGNVPYHIPKGRKAFMKFKTNDANKNHQNRKNCCTLGCACNQKKRSREYRYSTYQSHTQK